MRFRKKPVVIDAFQVGRSVPWPDWFHDAVTRNDVITSGMGKYTTGRTYCQINTLEGVMRGNEGDWIIRGVTGELYPCKPDVFAATYEPVEAA